MATAGKTDPFMSYRFKVEIDGITSAGASEVTGLQLETETETYEEGGTNDFVHILPKRTKYQHIILKRGITDKDDIWNWYKDVVKGKFNRKNGAIILMGVSKSDKYLWRWDFEEAYPVKWTGPEFRMDSNTVAFETIELAHHGISRKVKK